MEISAEKKIVSGNLKPDMKAKENTTLKSNPNYSLAEFLHSLLNSL